MSDREQIPSSITFHYIKSNFFRVVHADGAMGGFTPRGQIFFSLYSERAPLPDVTVQNVENNGQLGNEIIEQRKGSEGILRELEVGVVMDVQVAQSLVVWLQERIKIAEQMRSDSRVRESEVKA
ncbi:MAG: hypothetical protein WBP79_13625 [Candidatus Acidiferrales bacterium]